SVCRHRVTTFSIEGTGADAASGTAYFLVVTDGGPDHWGLYRDRYVRVDGAWRFAERRVRVEGVGADSAAARRGGVGRRLGGGAAPRGRLGADPRRSDVGRPEGRPGLRPGVGGHRRSRP